jgi:hypothetical protein
MLPALAGATAAKVLVCVFCIMLFVKSPLGGAKKMKKTKKKKK